jgi:hypothetical protein
MDAFGDAARSIGPPAGGDPSQQTFTAEISAIWVLRMCQYPRPVDTRDETHFLHARC